MKTIVTHLSPDLDAIASVWLIKKYLTGWDNAQIKLVPSGTTLDNQLPDSDKNVIHVDTGLGKFDHHQTNEYISATKLVYKYLLKEDLIDSKDIKPIEKIVEYVNSTDHFAEVFYFEPDSDRYDFMIRQLVDGLKVINREETKLIEIIFQLLDAVLIVFKNKVNAEEEIKNGFVFRSYLGKSLAIETKNEEAVKLALKKGFSLVVRRHPDAGFTRIKTLPDKKLSLKPVYEKILKIDKKGSWFFHISGHMLLNGSSGNPKLIPTPLSLNKIIEIVKSV
ncbi:MAG: DHH family phosphoesterase [Candidatus Roizmanbacteria bacterium]|nr:DHH family phosphoesterase [Candidatus Roizmanbacteria bacterium]